MPSSSRIDVFLLGVVALAVVVLSIGAVIGLQRSWVTVTVSSVNDQAEVLVDCEKYRAVYADDLLAGPLEMDLGWLRDDAIVTIQARNFEGDYGWDVAWRMDDREGTFTPGPAFVDDQTRRHRLVGWLSIQGSGRKIGTIGCQLAKPALRRGASPRFEPGFRRSFAAAALAWSTSHALVLAILVAAFVTLVELAQRRTIDVSTPVFTALALVGGAISSIWNVTEALPSITLMLFAVHVVWKRFRRGRAASSLIADTASGHRMRGS